MSSNTTRTWSNISGNGRMSSRKWKMWHSSTKSKKGRQAPALGSFSEIVPRTERTLPRLFPNFNCNKKRITIWSQSNNKRNWKKKMMRISMLNRYIWRNNNSCKCNSNSKTKSTPVFTNRTNMMQMQLTGTITTVAIHRMTLTSTRYRTSAPKS